MDDRAKEIQTLARSHAEAAIEALVEVMSDPDAKSAARVLAGKILLERGFGAPERHVEQEINHHIYDERVAHLEALKELSEKRFRSLTNAQKHDDNVIEGKFTPLNPVFHKSNYEE